MKAKAKPAYWPAPIRPSVIFCAMLRKEGLPAPELEYRFHPTRQWRFDYAWPEFKVALEQEGGNFMAKGAHNTPLAIIRDIQKYNAATELGWRVLRAIPSENSQKLDRPYITSKYMVDLLRNVLVSETASGLK